MSSDSKTYPTRPSPVRAVVLSLALAATALAGLLLSPAVNAAVDVGVSIKLPAPPLPPLPPLPHGRVDIGRFPHPELVLPQPVVIHRPRVMPKPIYLSVPPGHQKDWGKHCHRYQACGAPVYFVKEEWYRHHVHGHKHHGKSKHGHGKGHGRDHD